jgi:hypothetical protein
MQSLRVTLQSASSALKAANIEHALIGGFALAFYGINRATADIDFMADGAKKAEILAALTGAGFALIHETKEVLQFSGAGHLDVLLANRPLSRQMLKSAIYHQNVPIYVLAPEDIIGLKIQAYKNDPSRELQDKADIQALLTKNRELDWERIGSYADLFGERAAVEKLRGEK